MPSGLRVFCFPYAGGSSHVFKGWQHFLGSHELRAVTYPGTAERINEELVRALPALVDLLAAEITPLLDRPSLFFGHSLGGLVAFELARLLQTKGLSPAHVFVSACRSPCWINRDRRIIHTLPDDEFVESVR